MPDQPSSLRAHFRLNVLCTNCGVEGFHACRGTPVSQPKSTGAADGLPEGIGAQDVARLAKDLLDGADALPCPRCGISGLHSCTGAPIVWSSEDKARLAEVMEGLFPSREMHAPLPTNA